MPVKKDQSVVTQQRAGFNDNKLALKEQIVLRCKNEWFSSLDVNIREHTSGSIVNSTILKLTT